MIRGRVFPPPFSEPRASDRKAESGFRVIPVLRQSFGSPCVRMGARRSCTDQCLAERMAGPVGTRVSSTMRWISSSGAGVSRVTTTIETRANGHAHYAKAEMVDAEPWRSSGVDIVEIEAACGETRCHTGNRAGPVGPFPPNTEGEREKQTGTGEAECPGHGTENAGELERRDQRAQRTDADKQNAARQSTEWPCQPLDR